MSELKKVNIFPGRFQPFHSGHLKACEDAFKKNGLPVYIMYIHNEKFDSRKPFDDELTKKELERLVDKYEYIEGINWIRRPMPMTICRVCIENGYEQFVVPDDVGGRFSVLTAVGLLPIAVAGIEIDGLMKGAAVAMEDFSVVDFEKNCCYKARKTTRAREAISLYHARLHRQPCTH